MATDLNKFDPAKGMATEVVNSATGTRSIENPHQLGELALAARPIWPDLPYGHVGFSDPAIFEAPGFPQKRTSATWPLWVEADPCALLPAVLETLHGRETHYSSASEDTSQLAAYIVVNPRPRASAPSRGAVEPNAGDQAAQLGALLKAAESMWIVNRQRIPEFTGFEEPAQLSDPAAISAARDRLALITRSYEERDQETRLEQLREASSRLARTEPRELLNSLAVTHGLSWNTFGTMLSVTPAAIRKWRRGGSITPENREQLAALVAFFDMLKSIKEPIADLGSWIEMRVREDITLTPAAMYAMGPDQRWLLLEWARGYLDTATMLDRFDVRWRETYGRDPNFVVGEGPGGERAIVPR